MQIEQLEDNPLFNNIKQDDIPSLLQCLHAYTKDYAKDSEILAYGTCTTQIGLLLKGSALVVKDDAWGNRTIIDKLKENELFAEAYACLDKQALAISMIAIEPCNVLFLEVGLLTTTCEKDCLIHHQIIKNLLSIIARKNLMLTQKMEHITKRTTREKILSYLSSLSLQTKSQTIYIPFNRQQFADYLSVDRSALSSELSKMKKEGLLTFHKNAFHLF